MDPSDEVSKSLIKWVQTLTPNGTRSALELSDGVAILDIMIQISPESFQKLKSKIKTDVGNNWRLKVSNLKKILEALMEYYQDVLNMQLLDIGRPDVIKLGETNDLKQLGKLLRLLLGCAVNCDKKQNYITQIMALEESVQQCIMQAIQQLEEMTGGSGHRSGFSFSFDNDAKIAHLTSDLQAANEAKDNLAQQCHNLEGQLQSLQIERQALLTDYQMLANKMKDKMVDSLGGRDIDNRRQIDLLKEEVFKLENIKDDYAARFIEQGKQISALQEKNAELQQAADATGRLKDEVDALTESANKVQVLETAVASYKKKLEDYTDVKKELKILKDKNVDYLHQNLKYEEEIKKHNVWKNQSDLYKIQITELQQKLDEDIQKLDKANFMNKKLESKSAALQAEKERAIRERDTLREENEELKLGLQKSEDQTAMATELTPTEMKEKLRFLEMENKALRANNQEIESKQVQFDNVVSRLEKLSEQNRNANQRIVELETQLEEQHSKCLNDSQAMKESRDLKQKLSVLQETLAAKDHDLAMMQNKYARYLERAKEVAISLEPKTNGASESFRQHHMKEDEERLITTAFYKLSLACHRGAVDERLAMISAGQGHSFLSRQRQSTPRKPVMPFKTK